MSSHKDAVPSSCRLPPVACLELALEPHQLGRTSRLSVAAIGDDPFGIRVAAVGGAMYARDAGTHELYARELIQVCLPSIALVSNECAHGRGIARQELRPHFVADFECLLLDCGAEPSEQGLRGAAKGIDRSAEHAPYEAAPARVGGGHARALVVGKDHWQAIRRKHRTDRTRSPRNRCISRWGLAIRARLDHLYSMHLSEPCRLNR